MLNTAPSAEELVARLREQLPCTAEVTKHMPPIRDAEGNLLFRNKDLIEIQQVIDGGHGGGVVCMTSRRGGKDVVAVSLTHFTHLRFDLSHPSYREIRAYQLHRIRVLKAEQLREQCEKPLLPHQPRH